MNTISDISQVNSMIFNPSMPKTEKTPEKGDVFGEFYKAALDILGETNQNQLKAEKLQLDYATGKTDDMLSVVLAQEKAYASLNFTVQVTNKVIEAYREIMRIQL